MSIKKTGRLIGIVIGLCGSSCWAEGEVVITDPLIVDFDNVNTNYYGGSLAILGPRVMMGGTNTFAFGYPSFAGGENASTTNDNTFVWSDGTLFGSTLPCEFSAYAGNGFRLLGGPIFGDGSGLTNLDLSTAIAGSITSDKLAAGAVTAVALATGSVGSSAIATGAVTSASLASGSVGTAALATNAVTAATLAAGSVGTNKAVIAEWNAWGTARYMSVTGTPDLVMNPGRIVAGYGMNVMNISSTAYGASQQGYKSSGTQTIGAGAYGASQRGYNSSGTQTIGSSSYGASQQGANSGTQSISNNACGASQQGYNMGTQTIGSSAYGASQQGNNMGTQSIGSSAYGASQQGYNPGGTQTIGSSAYGASQQGYNGGKQTIGANASGASQQGYLAYNSFATNNGIGSLQLLNLTNSQVAIITGHASIGLGACTVTNDQAIVAGDGLVSQGKGTVTALGFFGNGAGLTNLNLSAAVPTNSVTADKLSANAVTTEKITDSSVTVAKLAINNNLSMDGNRVTNLATPIADGDAVTKAYLRSVLSALPPQGDLSMGSFTNGAPASFPLTF